MIINEITEASPWTNMVRRIKPVVSRDKYRRVAEKLHKVLLRKEKENGGVFRHALGWYTMNIGNAHKDIDHHVLKQFYLDHFDAVITD